MYSVLDIETTGGPYNEEGIMEIAIYRFDGHEVTDQFISLINPEREIQPYVAQLTGINVKMVRTAPKFHEVAKRIIEITEGTILVAHNAMFDYRILRTEYRRLGFDYQRETICTVSLSERLLPEVESYSLGKLVRELGIAVSDRHRANGDAQATLKLFKLLLNKDSEKFIVKETLRAPSLGELTQRQVDFVSDMPEEPGVFYLLNKYGDIHYVGFEDDLRRGLNRVFTSSGKIARAIQKGTKQVSFEKTGSHLIAQLKAREEIRKLRPRYNKVSRRMTNGAAIQSSEMANDPGISIFNGKDLVITDRGRSAGEKSVILIRDGELRGFGYCELNHQINNIHILESIITPMEGSRETLSLVSEYLERHPKARIIELKEDC